MANDSFLKIAAPLVVLTFVVVYNFSAIRRGFVRMPRLLPLPSP
jgi:hypothetical protein